MVYNVKTIAVFERQAKKLIKKYPSLKAELLSLVQKLKNEPNHGVAIGNSCFKIRLSIKSKGKGKSGGGRIITHFLVSESTVYLLTIYDKSKKESLSNEELEELLQFLPE
jgi:mRNA-degrading endonuclease RelE of RelBE toxin-antitoxin system